MLVWCKTGVTSSPVPHGHTIQTTQRRFTCAKRDWGEGAPETAAALLTNGSPFPEASERVKWFVKANEHAEQRADFLAHFALQAKHVAAWQQQLTWDALVRDGLRLVGGIGVDVTFLSAIRHGNQSAILKDTEACAAVSVLTDIDGSFARNKADASDWLQAHWWWRLDQPVRMAPCLLLPRHEDRSDDAHKLYKRLHTRGYLQVADWRAWGLDYAALYSEAQSVLLHAATKKKWADIGKPLRPLAVRDQPLHALSSLLRNQTLHTLISEYLGGEVRIDDVVCLRLPHALSDYPSAHWHHDRCGRRLKLFIFLSNVSKASHPTQLAAGTHNVLYYTGADSYGMSRYTNAYTQHHHRVVTLTGGAAGGFLFDTNALHRGVPDNGEPRTAVVVEFHAHGKVAAIGRCPSNGDKATTVYWTGRHGYDLYPPEKLNGVLHDMSRKHIK